LPAANPGPYTGPSGNNTWFLDGDEPTLIDAGIGQSSHLDALREALDGRSLVRLLLTHGHRDHAAGAPAIRALWPGVEVMKFPTADEAEWSVLRDGAFVRAGSVRLRVLHTPGHAADHVCFWDESSRDLFAGDMVIRPGSVLIPAGRGGNLRDYLRSLERMASLSPARILPGHGPIIHNPLDVIAEYQTHRRRREEQILILLSEGYSTTEAITDRLYAGIDDELRRAATMTVQAHLDKLREEGRLG
jgi:glyoxylase-like metal-dependent hydrolase (beta-lactamase superfamily II)